jgi:hypothetical protein
MDNELEPLRRQTALVENAERMLAQAAGDPMALGDVIRQSEAARVLARQVKLGTAAINSATAVKLRAEVRLADAIDAAQQAGEVATQAVNPGNSGLRTPETAIPATLADVGVDYRRLSEARTIRRLAPTSVEAEKVIVEAAAEATAAGREFSRSSVIEAVKGAERAEVKDAIQADVDAQSRADRAEFRAFERDVTPDDYDPSEDRHSAAVQQAIHTARDGILHLSEFSIDDIRRALNHSNPKVRDIVLPAYTDHLRTIVNVADRLRELL